MEMFNTSGHTVPLIPIRSTSDIFAPASMHGTRGASHEVQQCASDEGANVFSSLETMRFPGLSRFPSIVAACVSGKITLCLSHYVTEISHLYSLRDFRRHFGLCRATVHSDCCFFGAVYKYSYLLTYLLTTASKGEDILQCRGQCESNVSHLPSRNTIHLLLPVILVRM